MMTFTVDFEEQDASFEGKLGDFVGTGTAIHSNLSNLDYASSGHTGFAASEDIPTKITELENDANFITIDDVWIPVQSVNGQLGRVELDYQSIGADKAGAADEAMDAVVDLLDQHETDTNNPHEVTCAQIGAVPRAEYNPTAATADMTQPVGHDSIGNLFTKPNKQYKWKLIDHCEFNEDVMPATDAWIRYQDLTNFNGLDAIYMIGTIKGSSISTQEGDLDIYINNLRSPAIQYGTQKKGNTRNFVCLLEKINDTDIRMTSSITVPSSIPEPPQRVNYLGTVQQKIFRLQASEISSFGFGFPAASAKGFGADTDLYIYGRQPYENL